MKVLSGPTNWISYYYHYFYSVYSLYFLAAFYSLMYFI